MLKLSDFDYHLPKDFIAQFPARPRASSRLLVLNRKKNTFEHKYFYNLPEYINSQDVLVLNDTKVYPARLFAINTRSNKEIELLLLKELEASVFECLVRPARNIKEKDELVFDKGRLKAIVLSKEKFVKIKMNCADNRKIKNLIQEIGKVPLPPYIKREPIEADYRDYQTVYAKSVGAVAAPTAGLHFTPELLKEIKKKAAIPYLTLHTGYGTFAPVREEEIEKHKIHKEYFSIPKECAHAVNQAKQGQKRVFAVGTTTCRALESTVFEDTLKNTSAETGLFIYPPYNFKVVDALITNFHLPRTTLLMLVAAFCQVDLRSAKEAVELLMRVYKEAVREKYRFYSYGDAMLII
jgi:S-adenosylmethionine:tRNA ribosyltransferase-isomerase